MTKYLFLSIIAMLMASMANANAKNIHSAQLNDVNEPPEMKNGQCGGTIELDSGTLLYPGEGVINPGELCIWTIHLRTMDSFRMNFTSLDLPGDNADCSAAAVSIYGLSNLIPSDDPERYRYCNENNNGGWHFLTGNIATVVFYTTSSYSVNSSSTGFALHWEGSRFSPVPTLHSSTYSSSPTGVIWYPVEGEYPPNAAMTWLVNAATPNNASSLIVDILSVDFESCSLSDRCLCEALIIYDISQIGDLHEVDRFCGERNSAQLANVSSDFIVAFYSDNIDVPASGLGFQLDWRQQVVTTTTTTEYEPTTTEAPETTTVFPGPVISGCGGIIEGSTGTIEYAINVGETYRPYDQCIWTIRTNPPTTQIELTKTVSFFESTYDYLTAFSLVQRHGHSQSATLGQSNGNEEQVVMNGSIVILQFISDGSVQKKGFRLHFRAVGENQDLIRYGNDFNTPNINGGLVYPGAGSYYQNYEMSTFVLSKNYNWYTGALNLTIHSYSLESSTGCVYDGLLVYRMSADYLSQAALYCGTSNQLISHTPASAYVLVLYSDHSFGGYGFNVSWDVQTQL